MNNKKIGEYISTRRKNNQLTQKELADKLGVTDKAVSKWERGAGYPDISMLKPLSDILGVTVNELLEGEDCKNIQEDISEDNESEGNSVSKVLEYADTVMKSREHNIGKIGAAILSVSLFLAIFICVIVNIAVEHRLSWSYIVISSCIFSGCILIPPMLYKGHGLMVSLRFLTVLIIPFLASIQYASAEYTSAPEWLWSVGVPISFTWLFILWLLVVFYKYKKIKLWLTLAIGSLLCIPGEAITNTLASGYDNVMDLEQVADYSIIPSAFICICVAGIFIVYGLIRQKSNQRN